MSFWFWLLTGIISGFAYKHSYGAGRCILGCIIGGLIGAVCGFINFAASGGNLKVVAKSIVKLHRLTGGNFKEAYKIRVHSCLEGAVRALKPEAISLVGHNRIRNYTDLAVLDLNINAAPQGVSFDETYSYCATKISTYLLEMGIPRELVVGDNSYLVEDESMDLYDSFYIKMVQMQMHNRN